MIDEGETDWKVIGIDIRDPRAASINTLEDVEKHMRGYLAATVEWFRIYKIPAGKPENKFAFDGEIQNKVRNRKAFIPATNSLIIPPL